jgi:hypothetical protein
MLNLETKAIIHSRDIIWLHKMHKDWKKDKSTNIASNEDDPIELPIGMRTKKDKDKVTKVEITTDERNDKNSKVFREMKKLKIWFNPQAKQAVNDFKEGREISLDQVNLALFTTATVNEPTAFDEVWNCADKEHHKLWREAINRERSKMTKKEVWEVINQEDVPKDRSCIKNK